MPLFSSIKTDVRCSLGTLFTPLTTQCVPVKSNADNYFIFRLLLCAAAITCMVPIGAGIFVAAAGGLPSF